VKRWHDYHDDKIVHADGAIADFTLCGRAIEGINGDQPMVETRDLIDCPMCKAIITHCKKMKPSEIAKAGPEYLD
jgi:hypothetical protein